MSGIYVASKTKHAHIWKSFRAKWSRRETPADPFEEVTNNG